ncbi:MAG: S-methyl-5'-thioinosine phosphorylase [Burkholderiales bacterium]
MLAIIGGSGLLEIPQLKQPERRAITTPFGEPSAPITLGRLGKSPIAFLNRHGRQHSFAPHQINYRANIWALKSLGVKNIVSIATVGGIARPCLPGTLVIPHQIIDYTWGREQSFFVAGEPVTHVDFTEPYSANVRSALIASASLCAEPTINKAVYAVTQGPRLETAAEIDRLERDGADIVGMTAMPEAILAREIGICYGALAVVANFAAGRGDSRHTINLGAIYEVHREAMLRVVRILENLQVDFE